MTLCFLVAFDLSSARLRVVHSHSDRVVVAYVSAHEPLFSAIAIALNRGVLQTDYTLLMLLDTYAT